MDTDLTTVPPSRRSLLGVMGAAALAGIAFPFRPRATDIVLATAADVPPVGTVTVPPTVRHGVLQFPLPGHYLCNEKGERVALITGYELSRCVQPTDFTDYDGYQPMAGSRQLRLQCEVMPSVPTERVLWAGDLRIGK